MAAKQRQLLIFAVDAIYACVSVGHVLFVAFAIWAEQRSPHVMLVLSEEGQTVFLFCVAAFVAVGATALALGVLALGIASAPLKTTRGALTALFVCSIPIAFAIYYFVIARKGAVKILQT